LVLTKDNVIQCDTKQFDYNSVEPHGETAEKGPFANISSS